MNPAGKATGDRGGAQGWALVTGASRGIGAAFAQGLAARGQRLVLTARTASDLEAVAARVRRPGVDVECVTADLAAPGGPARLLATVAERGWAVDLLINNAGFGSLGPFAGLPFARELGEVDVNVRALVELTHGVLPGMRGRGRGAIMQVASTAAFQPLPYMATYAATKAFVLSFSLALYGELRGEGIHVMALCPGPTDTPFFAAAGIKPLRSRGPLHRPEQVVAWGLRGLDRRRPVVVCGAGNRIGAWLGTHVPRRAVARLVARAMQGRWQGMAASTK